MARFAESAVSSNCSQGPVRLLELLARAGAWSRAATSLLPISENRRYGAGFAEAGTVLALLSAFELPGFRSYHRVP